jgi:hypothetical protein
MQEMVTYFVTTLDTSTEEHKTQSESKRHPKHFRLNAHTVPLHVSENDTYQSSKLNLCPAKILCHLKKVYSSCKKLLTQEGLLIHTVTGTIRSKIIKVHILGEQSTNLISLWQRIMLDGENNFISRPQEL